MAFSGAVLRRLGVAAIVAAAGWSAHGAAFADDSNRHPRSRMQIGEPSETQGTLAPQRKSYSNDGTTFQDIGSMLTADGYGEILSIRRAGDVWNVVAVRNNGAIHKLAISVAGGEILERRKAGWTRVPTPGITGMMD